MAPLHVMVGPQRVPICCVKSTCTLHANMGAKLAKLPPPAFPAFSDPRTSAEAGAQPTGAGRRRCVVIANPFGGRGAGSKISQQTVAALRVSLFYCH